MGFGELIIVVIVGLLVVRPEKLPETIRTLAKYIIHFKQKYYSVRHEVENQLGIDDIKRDLHNAEILKELDELETKSDEGLEHHSILDSKSSIDTKN